jgi:HEPN domain-containing protein
LWKKTLKAIYEYKEEKVPKVHKIQSLIDNLDIDLELDDNLIQLLDTLYIESRYPADLGLLPYGKPTLEDAQELYKFAQNTFNMVCNLLNIEKSEFI